MSLWHERITENADRCGLTPRQGLRHHLIDGIVRRIGQSAQSEAFILRGGTLARYWFGPARRPADDLDLVGTFPHSVEETVQRLTAVLHESADDGITFLPRIIQPRGIWLDGPFPGVRCLIRGTIDERRIDVSLDIGFNDPLIPPATPQQLRPIGADESITAWAVRPETALAWKLHGLAEKGPSQWRPKDLDDVALILERAPLDREQLPAAIDAAFRSRGDDPARLMTIWQDAEWWPTLSAEKRWSDFIAAHPERDPGCSLMQLVARIEKHLHGEAPNESA